MSDAILFALGGVVMIFAIAGTVLYGALRFNTWVEDSEVVQQAAEERALDETAEAAKLP